MGNRNRQLKGKPSWLAPIIVGFFLAGLAVWIFQNPRQIEEWQYNVGAALIAVLSALFAGLIAGHITVNASYLDSRVRATGGFAVGVLVGYVLFSNKPVFERTVYGNLFEGSAEKPGKPVKDATVRLVGVKDRKELTDENGYFIFNDVTGKVSELTIEHESQTTDPQKLSLDHKYYLMMVASPERSLSEDEFTLSPNSDGQYVLRGVLARANGETNDDGLDLTIQVSGGTIRSRSLTPTPSSSNKNLDFAHWLARVPTKEDVKFVAMFKIKANPAGTTLSKNDFSIRYDYRPFPF
jgi:hypothetical protein